MKTLSYDCGNPVQYVCGHSPAVLFYLLDRHALLAMTMGSKGIFLKSLTTPPRWGTPPMEGNWLRTVAGQSSPLRRGGRSPGWSLYPTPRRALHDTPPALEPPTQTMFARGPVVRWAFCLVIARAYSPLSFPRPGSPQTRMCLWGGQGGNLISLKQ